MHTISDTLEVEAENLEFFLYEFGLNLKQPRSGVHMNAMREGVSEGTLTPSGG